MPSVSKKQARLFAGAAHSPSFARKVGVSQAVARDFNQADKGSGILNGPRPKPKGKAPDFEPRP